MYIRFISPERASRGRGYYGVFQAAFDLVYDDCTPDFVYAPVREILDWFNDNLPAPTGRDFRVRSRKRWHADGICWFRDDAQDGTLEQFVLSGGAGGQKVNKTQSGVLLRYGLRVAEGEAARPAWPPSIPDRASRS